MDILFMILLANDMPEPTSPPSPLSALGEGETGKSPLQTWRGDLGVRYEFANSIIHGPGQTV